MSPGSMTECVSWLWNQLVMTRPNCKTPKFQRHQVAASSSIEFRLERKSLECFLSSKSSKVAYIAVLLYVLAELHNVFNEPLVMTVSRCYRAGILDFFFIIIFFRPILCLHIGNSPDNCDSSWTHTPLETLHFPCHRISGRGNSSEFEKLHLVRTEFPGVVSLPWNWDLPGSALNMTCQRRSNHHLANGKKMKQFHGAVKCL